MFVVLFQYTSKWFALPSLERCVITDAGRPLPEVIDVSVNGKSGLNVAAPSSDSKSRHFCAAPAPATVLRSTTWLLSGETARLQPLSPPEASVHDGAAPPATLVL